MISGRGILYGPVSDMVPSSTVRDVSLGFLTIASYLHDRGMKCGRQSGAAHDEQPVDVPRFLARLKPKAVGIDLHWLPHAHGALKWRARERDLSGRPVIMGGLSSSYFHEN